MSLIDNFIKSNDIDGRFINISMQMHSKDNDIYNLGNQFIIDRKNQKSIKTCKIYFKEYYNNDFKNNDFEIIKLTITYSMLNYNQYIDYIKEYYKGRNSFINLILFFKFKLLKFFLNLNNFK